MSRPLGLLRAGYPYLKTLGMRRVTNYPYDLAFGPDDKLYILCRTSGAALIRVWTFDDAERLTDDLVQIGAYGAKEGQFQWPVQIVTDCEGNLYVSDEATHKVSKFNPDGEFVSRWGNEGRFPVPYSGCKNQGGEGGHEWERSRRHGGDGSRH